MGGCFVVPKVYSFIFRLWWGEVILYAAAQQISFGDLILVHNWYILMPVNRVCYFGIHFICLAVANMFAVGKIRSIYKTKKPSNTDIACHIWYFIFMKKRQMHWQSHEKLNAINIICKLECLVFSFAGSVSQQSPSNNLASGICASIYQFIHPSVCKSGTDWDH